MPPPVATPTHVLYKPAHPSGPRCRARVAWVVGLLTATALALPGGTGFADPAPTLDQVQARVDALDLQVDLAVEDYQQAQVALEGLRLRVATAQADAQRQQDALAALQVQVGQVVAAAYRSGTVTAGWSLMTRSSTPQAYLDRATSLEQMSSRQAAQLAEVTTARARLVAAQRRTATDLAAQQVVEQQAAARRSTIETDLAASQALLSGLQATQRQQLEAAQVARSAQDAARTADVARATRSRDAAATPAAPAQPAAGPTFVGPASGRAAVAVREAYAKLGSPYVWGSGGPSTFDCSGLTSWVWAKAGVSLPHSSAAQYASGRKVSRDQIQPGDLVYYGSPIHHVGIYVGDGKMISAPHTGDVVRVQDAFRSDFVGATRP